MRKALLAAGMEYVPVIPLSMAGIEKHPGWRLTVPMYLRMAYGVLYADLLMDLSNQCRPYELSSGSADALALHWIDTLSLEMRENRPSMKRLQENYRKIFDFIPDPPEDDISSHK